jgi:hypothetical protein
MPVMTTSTTATLRWSHTHPAPAADLRKVYAVRRANTSARSEQLISFTGLGPHALFGLKDGLHASVMAWENGLLI